MHDLSKHLTPISMKGNSFEAASWKLCNREFSVYDIWFSIKDGLHLSIHDELEDNQEDYFYLTHGDLCNLLSKIKVKDNRKRADTQIKNIETPIAASYYDSDASIRVLYKKRSRTVLHRKQKGKNTPENYSV